MTLETIVAQAAISLLIAVTVALITGWLSLRRFYREKWWEAKMRAYSDVIQALHHMRYDLEISLESAYEGERAEETEYQKKWGEKHREAWEEIRKQIDIGEFLYSPKSMELLRAFEKAARSDDPNDMYWETLERAQTAVHKYMPLIKAAARSDLGLPRVKQSGADCI